ncbi:OmpH domain containing protein [Pyrenophora tritici-repentis]|uniref:OmpH domain containing protein n=2 Tax=Pyrenophora tritici-repentis TaxID=45151 RepID=A0A2W1HRJ7_9PLEO|nr:uncharacterized protein PTRG_02965 [Pyrenophora tritici-repentis Pt-1C-BFP]KAF7574930.1 OmpH domain containing protein [Pyrenophora tritici-repentis]EDU45488.1 predicted protein [Pyrenophora tritici-repentis Pt-1C-BFP]KAI1672539.1 hypothetical protein L13192_03398 [Pyrenophora tritici-repentis]KAI1686564.1 hypothetical protein KJE20_04529 [Pyrenophora tritici-repentis]PZD47367.1 OmpH domain containing protein [Pyrenophora tritici-repentis]
MVDSEETPYNGHYDSTDVNDHGGQDVGSNNGQNPHNNEGRHQRYTQGSHRNNRGNNRGKHRGNKSIGPQPDTNASVQISHSSGMSHKSTIPETAPLQFPGSKGKENLPKVTPGPKADIAPFTPSMHGRGQGKNKGEATMDATTPTSGSSPTLMMPTPQLMFNMQPLNEAVSACATLSTVSFMPTTPKLIPDAKSKYTTKTTPVSMDDAAELIIDEKTLSTLSDLKGAHANGLRNTLTEAYSTLRNKQNHANTVRDTIEAQIIATEEKLRICEVNMLQLNDRFATRLERAQATAHENDKATMYLQATHSIRAAQEHSEAMKQFAKELGELQNKRNKVDAEIRRLNQELVDVLYGTIKHALDYAETITRD